tara:strand:- start:26 stop:508 length:483 start_codon:yes stop_codon:yes gene_type:complete
MFTRFSMDAKQKEENQASKKENKKNPLQKLKEGFDDKEEQLQVLSTFVRLGVVIWSGFILTLNYVELPGLGKQERIDPTFIASVFTGALASFGLETAKKRGDGTYKADEEKKKAEAAGGFANGVPYTIIKVETPIKLVPEKAKIDPVSGKEVDPQNGRLT